MISKVGNGHSIYKPNVVLTNGNRQKRSNTCLVWCSCSLQCALKPKSWLDHILKDDAHHTKVISTAHLLSNGRKRTKRDGRSHQPQGETTQHGELIRCRKYALLVLLLPAAVGSFSFAAMQQAIKNPTRGGAVESERSLKRKISISTSLTVRSWSNICTASLCAIRCAKR